MNKGARQFKIDPQWQPQSRCPAFAAHDPRGCLVLSHNSISSISSTEKQIGNVVVHYNTSSDVLAFFAARPSLRVTLSLCLKYVYSHSIDICKNNNMLDLFDEWLHALASKAPLVSIVLDGASVPTHKCLFNRFEVCYFYYLF